MSAEPVISPSGERLYQRLLPIMQQDEDYDWFGRYLCGALMDGMLQGFDDIVLGSEIDGVLYGPWCIIAVPKVCPAAWLPWEASIYGVTLSPGTTAEAQRQTIEELPPQKRGGIEAMYKAAAPTLIGTGTAEAPEFTMTLIERPAGVAYKIVGNTFPEQTKQQEEATIAALTTQKPGGVKLAYSSGTPLWETATLEWDKVGTTVEWSAAESGEV
jgi:hypothetical protein